ncbi:unnamed protein product, partial [Brassica rapa]
SRLDFLEVVWNSWKLSGIPGSLLTKSPFHNRSDRFGNHLNVFGYAGFSYLDLICRFSDLEDFWDDLHVSLLKSNALDDIYFSLVSTSWKSSDEVFFHIKWSLSLSL